MNLQSSKYSHFEKIKFLCFGMFLLIFLFPCALKGKHIVGGDIAVKRIASVNGTTMPRYQITLNIYRDCYQGGTDLTDFDSLIDLGVYKKEENHWQFFSSKRAQRNFQNGQRLSLGDNIACLNIPPNLCVDINQYVFEIDLPLHEDSYLVSYQRCCRNETITNLVDPEDTGVAITYELTAASQQAENSSPVFNELPPILVCAGIPFSFDHSATDNENDLLVYEFFNPLTAGGSDTNNSSTCGGTIPNPSSCLPPFDRVIFRQPVYSFDNPLPAMPTFKIDPNTGIITGTPNTIGQFLVGICVKEYRDGILLSEVRREIQVNVTTCTNSREDLDIYIPNIITVNNDNINDKFIISTNHYNCIDQITYTIFNEQDEAVFENIISPTQNESELWDGKLSGFECSSGATYTFDITIKTKFSNNITASGNLYVYFCGSLEAFLERIPESSDFRYPVQQNGSGLFDVSVPPNEDYNTTCRSEIILCLLGITPTNVITPNGDNSNDVLRFTQDSEITDSELWVYNRWGNEIYHKENYTNDWDASGYSDGIYFYVLKIGELFIKKTLTIAR